MILAPRCAILGLRRRDAERTRGKCRYVCVDPCEFDTHSWTHTHHVHLFLSVCLSVSLSLSLSPSLPLSLSLSLSPSLFLFSLSPFHPNGCVCVCVFGMHTHTYSNCRHTFSAHQLTPSQQNCRKGTKKCEYCERFSCTRSTNGLESGTQVGSIGGVTGRELLVGSGDKKAAWMQRCRMGPVRLCCPTRGCIR